MSDSLLQPLITKMKCFATLSEADEVAVRGVTGRLKNVPPREALSIEGSTPSNVVLLLDGVACRYKRLPNHRRQIMSFMLPGDLSDFRTFTPRVLDHGAETISECRVLEIPRPALAELMARPTVAEAMNVSATVEEAIIKEWLVNVGRRTSVERVAHLLCEFLFRFRAIGLADDDRMTFPVTKIDLADSTCLSVVHINRILQDFREGGIIGIESDILEIRDPQALQRIGGFSEEYLELASTYRAPGSDFSQGPESSPPM